MPLAISSKHLSSDLPVDKRTWSIEQKFDLFEARVIGWQLDIANNMLNKGIKLMEHSGFAALSVCVSFFEMIAKYFNGYVIDASQLSRKYFKEGLNLVYPGLLVCNPDRLKSNKNYDEGDSIYMWIRCGLYHNGQTYKNVVISAHIASAILIVNPNGIIINPHILISDLLVFFESYKVMVIGAKPDALRRSLFEKRFNYDNNIQS